MVMKTIAGFLFAVIVVSACSAPEFTGSSNVRGNTKKKAGGEGVGGSADGTGSQANGEGVGGTGSQANGEGVGGKNSANFKYGPKSTPNDVLFIFDDSSSMGNDLAKVKAGFEKLAGTDWFGDSRIAVMTTLPGDPSNLSNVHPDVDKYSGIQFEPGFLSFVSSAAFDVYRTNGGKIGAYPQPLCAEEWFAPGAVNSNGQRCLSVALQNPHHGVGCEAGMTALSQIHDKKGKIFRDGSFAQVVFVSDAQDPGCGSSALQNGRPSGEALRNKVIEKNKISGLKFHGVLAVEGGQLTDETQNGKTFGYPYNQLVKSTNGLLIDITASTDYSDFAKSLAKSALPEPVFPLPQKASKINGVKVAGQLIAPERVQLSADGLSVRIDGLDPKSDVEIVIGFTP